MSTYSEDSCKPYYVGVINPCTYTYMYRVYLNPKEERVLVTRTKVAGEGWVLVTKHATWDKAYRKALYLANRLDYVLEWFLEDQIQQTLQIFKN